MTKDITKTAIIMVSLGVIAVTSVVLNYVLRKFG